jgi:hypothetical protein
LVCTFTYQISLSLKNLSFLIGLYLAFKESFRLKLNFSLVCAFTYQISLSLKNLPFLIGLYLAFKESLLDQSLSIHWFIPHHLKF